MIIISHKDSYVIAGDNLETYYNKNIGREYTYTNGSFSKIYKVDMDSLHTVYKQVSTSSIPHSYYGMVLLPILTSVPAIALQLNKDMLDMDCDHCTPILTLKLNENQSFVYTKEDINMFLANLYCYTVINIQAELNYITDQKDTYVLSINDGGIGKTKISSSKDKDAVTVKLRVNVTTKCGQELHYCFTPKDKDNITLKSLAEDLMYRSTFLSDIVDVRASDKRLAKSVLVSLNGVYWEYLDGILNKYLSTGTNKSEDVIEDELDSIAKEIVGESIGTYKKCCTTAGKELWRRIEGRFRSPELTTDDKHNPFNRSPGYIIVESLPKQQDYNNSIRKLHDLYYKYWCKSELAKDVENTSKKQINKPKKAQMKAHKDAIKTLKERYGFIFSDDFLDSLRTCTDSVDVLTDKCVDNSGLTTNTYKPDSNVNKNSKS